MTTPRSGRPRLRDLGIEIGSQSPGERNAITDVAGVRVGMTTLVSGEGPLIVGSGPVRTGVTTILPCDRPWESPVFAGIHRLNGSGEMTGSHWIEESGLLTTPIAITNTHAVGPVHEGLLRWEAARRSDPYWFTMPVVAETYDGLMSDINGGHVRPEHAVAALEAASTGAVPEGNVGGGTGMAAHGFKGGTGTSSRVTPEGWTVGVLVQANYGVRERFRVDGRPIGRVLDEAVVPGLAVRDLTPGAGSVIVVAATDAPLLAHQCTRLARRASLGIGRLGGLGENSSGDLFLAFGTGNLDRVAVDPSLRNPEPAPVSELATISNAAMNPLFAAVVEATEEAVVNAMLAADTMVGVNGNTLHALTPDLLLEAWRATGPAGVE